MNKKISSERIALMMVLILLGTIVASIFLASTSIVLAGDKGTFGKAQDINLYNLTTWQGVSNITDTAADNLNKTVTNATDIKNVWVCNNYTYLFARVDVAENFSTNNFTIQLYIEDAVQKRAGNDTLLYPNDGITTNDINATFLFSYWSNGTFARYNFTGGQWTFDQALTNATTQGAFNWTQNSFVMMIQLSYLSSNGTVATGNSFKFDVYTGWSTDGKNWYAADYLDFAKYTLTGTIIPEFPSLALMFALLLLTSSALVITKKSKLLR